MQSRAVFQFASNLLLVWMAAVASVSAQCCSTSPLIVTERDDGKSLQLMVGQKLPVTIESHDWLQLGVAAYLRFGRQRETGLLYQRK